MVSIETVVYGSEDYKKTCSLRDKVMRQPLGLSIENDDLSYEEDAVVVIAKDEGEVVGTGILVMEEQSAHVKFICVDSQSQKGGIGKLILFDLEERAKNMNASVIELEARVSARDFYKKYGYIEYGKEYMMSVAPVPHVAMKKEL